MPRTASFLCSLSQSVHVFLQFFVFLDRDGGEKKKKKKKEDSISPSAFDHFVGHLRG